MYASKYGEIYKASKRKEIENESEIDRSLMVNSNYIEWFKNLTINGTVYITNMAHIEDSAHVRALYSFYMGIKHYAKMNKLDAFSYDDSYVIRYNDFVCTIGLIRDYENNTSKVFICRGIISNEGIEIDLNDVIRFYRNTDDEPKQVSKIRHLVKGVAN